MMSKAHFKLFFTLFILLASPLVVQIEGWGCNDLNCALACRLNGFHRGGLCQGLIFKNCVCIGQIQIVNSSIH
ncbi:hypothetical protein P8452_28391 [Trifolium repens]|nr:hypothetical protein P8452_28391 [Trifolium repens]